MNRFFTKELQAGDTIHTPGFAAGIAAMARALAGISVFNGKVSWGTDNVPKIIPGASAGGTAAAFEVVSESGDYLMCARVASFDANQQPVPVAVTEGETETLVKVWKPWILRRTPFDNRTRDGMDYVYSSAAVRTCTPTGGDPEDAETQYVTPSYSIRASGQAGELIHAFAATPPFETPATGEFMDANFAGRCWAVGDEVGA